MSRVAVILTGRESRERVMSRVEFDTNGGCWLWSGTLLASTGYGQIQIDGIAHLAHRLSYALFIGEIPPGLFVLHRCDNRACINPNHLFLGTHAANMGDMRAKGRSSRGLHCAKLTEPDIGEIRRLRASGLLQREIADRFGVSQVKISQVLAGKSWAHVK